MKREALLFIFAGFLIGSVLTYVALKTFEQNKALKSQDKAAVKSAVSPEKISEDEHFEMMQDFIKSAEKNPDDVKSRITLGNIYYDKGKFKEAIKWYEEAYKIDPLNTDLLVDLGACYREENPKKSIEFFDKALAIDPKKQQALYNKVIVNLVDLKDIAAAKESFESLKKRYPDFPMLEQIRSEIEMAEKEK